MIPDKTYPLSVVGDLLASMSPNEIVFMPDKIYFDGVDTSTTPRLAINEEYIRKDALLEWLEGRMTMEGATEGFVGGYDFALKDVINKINSM